jgi:hypothetical protein
MFESGIGPGVRSDRFGTWSLITFLLLFVPVLGYVAIPGLSLLAWVPVVACVGTTLGALGCGLVGVFVSGQRRPALHGLLKAAVPTVVGGSVFLFILALSSMNFE